MTAISMILLTFVGAAGLMEVSSRLLQFRGSLSTSLPTAVKFEVPPATCESTFVSVHVPTHAEPPELVIATLHALARSRCKRFEVIVIDNNTPDPANWLPLQAACETLGTRFRFVHRDGVQGAKAGALNIALAIADPRTTHVAVVDADYQVHPDFLSDGLRALAAGEVDYVQFPQAYRDVARSAQGVEHELGDYFACFEGGAGRPGSMLPTGTLSLFSYSALRAVGGWPTRTITEDAEIGVRLQRAGYRGVWLARKRGRGLLPMDFEGLQVQRARWVAGNFQVLKDLCVRRWQGLTLRDFTNLTVQLTAWISLWLPLAAGLVLAALAPALPYARLLAAVAAASILASAALTSLRMTISSKAGRVGWNARLGAVVTKLALSWTSATAWLPALTPRQIAFKRTCKFPGPRRSRDGIGLAALSIIFLMLATLYAIRDQVLEAAACALLGSTWFCARRVDAGLRAAAQSDGGLAAEFT